MSTLIILTVTKKRTHVRNSRKDPVSGKAKTKQEKEKTKGGWK